MVARRSRWRARGTACVLAAVCVAGAGCSPSALNAASLHPSVAAGHATSGSPGAGRAGSAGDSGGAGAKDPAGHSSAVTSPAAACVTRVYTAMTPAQRVGQLFLVGEPDDVAVAQTLAAVREYHFGSVLLQKSSAGTAALAASAASIQALAGSATAGARFFVAANQEGGEIQQLTGDGFVTIPSALEQGTWTLSELRAQAATWGSDLRAAGVNLDLAPVMDVVPAATAATNAPIGELDREFGSTPEGNGAHGTAFIQGLARAGVASTAKHFPGLGLVSGNTDFTSNVVDSITTANDQDLGSFRTVIKAGVPFVMIDLATYTRIDPDHLAAFSPVVVRLLRSGLGFTGVIMSDDLGEAAAVESMPAGDRAIDFLDAGGDMITSQVLPPAEQMASAVLARASSDATFRAVVDGAVKRVLAAKQAQGLLRC